MSNLTHYETKHDETNEGESLKTLFFYQSWMIEIFGVHYGVCYILLR